VSLVMGIDQHRAQVSAEWIDTITGEVSRARVAPADRAAIRKFLAGFKGQALEVALEATTGWRFLVEELDRVGAETHLAEVVQTSGLKGRGKRPKTVRQASAPIAPDESERLPAEYTQVSVRENYGNQSGGASGRVQSRGDGLPGLGPHKLTSRRWGVASGLRLQILSPAASAFRQRRNAGSRPWPAKSRSSSGAGRSRRSGTRGTGRTARGLACCRSGGRRSAPSFNAMTC
jgi:hypothetical protein